MLKDDEQLPWKGIAAGMSQKFDKKFQVAALQMKYKRLKDRIRSEAETQVRAFRMLCAEASVGMF